MKRAVIFGGCGFIGTHLAQFLLQNPDYSELILVDILPPRNEPYTAALQLALASGRAVYIEHDIRHPVPSGLLDSGCQGARIEAVYNLAAVHREPGHKSHEYFDTNIRGAENVCAWADTADCKMLVFTSSISPYGPSEDAKTEATLPVPETAYGSSKLVAEKIHLAWQTAASDRALLIVRPGVVFGPGEGGNVTRLVRSLARGYFVYAGNRRTIKAAGYVKELCLVIQFGLNAVLNDKSRTLLLNFTMDPPPTMEDMVKAICKTLKRNRRPLSLPRGLLMGAAHSVTFATRFSNVKYSLDPVRVRKLFRSTHVVAEGLRTMGYQYAYTLESAFQDWKKDIPADFTG